MFFSFFIWLGGSGWTRGFFFSCRKRFLSWTGWKQGVECFLPPERWLVWVCFGFFFWSSFWSVDIFSYLVALWTKQKWEMLLDFVIPIDIGCSDGHRIKIFSSEEINKMLIGKLNPPQCCCLYDWNPKWAKLQRVLCCFPTPNAFCNLFP